MSLKNTLKTMFFLSCAVTTFLFLFIALQGVFFNLEISFSDMDMLKLISVSFASSLPTLIFAGQETAPHRRIIFLRILHFVLTAGAVFGLQIFYGFMDATNAAFVAVVFIVIYVTAYIIIEIREKRLADRLNEKINAFHNTENETHGE
jgi:hypothetical protein